MLRVGVDFFVLKNFTKRDWINPITIARSMSFHFLLRERVRMSPLTLRLAL